MTKKWAKWQRRCLRAQGPQYQGAATSECCHSTQKHRAQGSDEETRPGWLLSARTRNTVYNFKIKCSIEVFSVQLNYVEITWNYIQENSREHRKAFTHSHRIFSEHILSRLDRFKVEKTLDVLQIVQRWVLVCVCASGFVNRYSTSCRVVLVPSCTTRPLPKLWPAFLCARSAPSVKWVFIIFIYNGT